MAILGSVASLHSLGGFLTVIPAEAGIQASQNLLDPRFRRCDDADLTGFSLGQHS